VVLCITRHPTNEGSARGLGSAREPAEPSSSRRCRGGVFEPGGQKLYAVAHIARNMSSDEEVEEDPRIAQLNSYQQKHSPEEVAAKLIEVST
jgi:hypothetical protein